MWPKALTTLVELVPHLTRLVPMADNFLSAKTADQQANTRAMEQMAEGLRGDLGQVTASHAGLYRQLNDLDEKTNTIAADMRATRSSVESLEARLKLAEQKAAATNVFLFVALGIIATLGIVTVVLLLRH